MGVTQRVRIAASCVLALLAVGVAYHVTRTHPFSWIDLEVYRWGGDVARSEPHLYETLHPTLGMPFTYTPFAALCFAALGKLHLLTRFAWTTISLLALLRMSWLLARERGAWLPGLHAGWVTLSLASAIVLSEPGTSTIRLGQVGFLLPWMVCEDLLSRRERRAGGLVGLAAAIKLTPGAYLVFLALVARWRTLAVAAGTIAASVVLGWALMPTASAYYWKHLGPDVETVGPVTTEEHWSINGAVWRLFDGGNDAVWLPLALVVLAGSLLLARIWWRGGERVGAIGLVGLGSVLASPFSWSHHWVIIAPLFVGLLGAIPRARHARLHVGIVTGAYALLVTGVWWHVPRVVLEPILGSSHGAALAANSYLFVSAMLYGLAWRLRPVAARRSDAAHYEALAPLAAPAMRVTS